MKGLFRSRKFRQGSLATAITVIVAAIVVVVNVVVTALTDRYSLTIDLTPEKLFSITDETKEYLTRIDRDVTVYVLSTEENFTGMGQSYLQALEVLKKFALASDHIKIEYVDLNANPAFAQNYPSLQLSSSSILITCGDKTRDLVPSQLYDIESNMYGQSQATASKAEQVFTSALLAITSDETINVAVITGHNEESAQSLSTLLNDNNYLIGEVNLTTSEIDPMYTAAVIMAPGRDFTEEELSRLDAFLSNGKEYGKTLFYFASGNQSALPNLDAFLADWGIQVGEGMVQENDSARYTPGNPFIAILDYAEDTYSASSIAANMVPITAGARPMEVLFESKSSISTTTLLQFANTASIRLDEETEVPPDGAIPHMIMGQHLSYSGTTAQNSQVVACGSSAFLDTSLLDNPNFANADYILGLFADLTGRTEDPVRIKSKSLAGTALNATAGQALVLGVVLVIVLPLTVLISGLVIWGRRRHR